MPRHLSPAHSNADIPIPGDRSSPSAKRDGKPVIPIQRAFPRMVAGHPTKPLVQQPEAGDMVVMRVAGHYNIGRAEKPGEPMSAMTVRNRLNDALDLARRFVTGQQRVFLYAHADAKDPVEVGCGNPP